ncbi:hypothetical protein Nepgr_000997 [Nepenthes gracilis]|uniref:Uncharacterized protein n=1 Tax=Nepenthes gracilis TaxID=150966 RepID=A0AAD3P4E9_NEPGR|nr:hypothetical protein Nepgr_000997 [Nepenthes gracilis]
MVSDRKQLSVKIILGQKIEIDTESFLKNKIELRKQNGGEIESRSSQSVSEPQHELEELAFEPPAKILELASEPRAEPLEPSVEPSAELLEPAGEMRAELREPSAEPPTGP